MKTKLFIIITLLFVAFSATAQEKLTTKSGLVKFEASTPNFEPVAAINEATSAILKEDGTIAVLTLVKGFQFKKALMQKHFNSKKWVNSNEFPKTKFEGQVHDYDFSKLTKEPKELRITGKLTFHGVTKEIGTVGFVSKENGIVTIKSKFAVKVADYGIVVKSKLASKIAETVNIVVNLKLK